MPLRETVLQFGAGNFLRAFADYFIHHANEDGQDIGRVVVVQSTPGSRAQWMNDRQGAYHVVIRGLEGGKKIDRVEEVRSVSRALVARTDWLAVLDFARSPDLKYILSNTTEAGFQLHDGDRSESSPPESFPAKLLQVLRARFEAGAPVPTIIPCELRDDNADLLRRTVLDIAEAWKLDDQLKDWIRIECVWWNTLVDRIVTGRPAEHPMLDEDPLLVVGEPFALWAIETRGAPFIENPLIKLVDDVKPYALRKVRILNGAHTALVCKTRGTDLLTVRQAVEDPEVGAWLRRLLLEEILPTVDDRIEDGAAFVQQILERFANPFVEHKFSDIELHHDTKIGVRLVPTRDEFRQKFGREPELLSAILEAEPGATPA